MTGPLSVAFLGSGKMATALAKAWTAAGLIDAAASAGADPVPAAREAFTAATGMATVPTNSAAIAGKQVVVLSVKPQMMAAVIAEIAGVLGNETLVVSIAAGITLAQLRMGLKGHTRVVRVMPNTPCLVNASAAGYAGDAPAADMALVAKWFGSVGVAMPLPEKLLDAVTGLSGSGPAYVFTFIEALADGGVKMGLPRDAAVQLAAQTVLGAAKMVLETGVHPAVLRDAVTSPAGTTIAGLHALEAGALRGTVISAVEAATRRATELGVQSAVK
jgi:pyrroline-5-carboxylate reductase